jgi:deoxyribonuclease V
MSRPISRTWRWFVLLGFAAILGFQTGCVQNVAWLPDSSGVIYSNQEGTCLRHYDLDRKTTREFVASTNAKTPCVGVSPDGKLVAVARLMKYPDRDSTVEVVFFDLAGKEVKRGRAHTWSKDRDPNGPNLELVMVSWPLPNKLLIYSGTTGIYDRERDQIIQVEEVMPWLTGNTPVRPDRKMFLAELQNGDQPKLGLVDWEGKIQPLNWVIPQGNLAPCVELIWDGNIARLVSAEAAWLVDTDKKTIKELEKGAPNVLKGEGELRCMHTFPEGGYRLCVFQCKIEGKDSNYARIELQKPADRKQLVLVKKVNPFLTLFPSPDRKRVAVRYGSLDDPKKERRWRISRSRSKRGTTVIACVDVYYRDPEALAACVLFKDWSDAESCEAFTERIPSIQPYHPGQFYKRELPCLLAVLGKVPGTLDVVVVDGYVWLGDETTPGLGAHLYEALGRKIAVIGVAKSHFHRATAAQPVLRGESERPLFVSAVGLDRNQACGYIQSMHGAYRIPTLLKQVDWLCRTI